MNFSNAQGLEKVWQTTAELKTPESVLYDQERDVIYVSNINGDPAQKDGNGKLKKGAKNYFLPLFYSHYSSLK